MRMREEIGKQVIVKLNRKGRRMEGWTALGKSFLLVFLFLSFLGWGHGVQAQEYPTRPITLLICFGPGGGTDSLARMIAQAATKSLGQEVIPVSKPGGGGALSVGILASSKADGYTILAVVSSPLTSTPHVTEVPYDTLKDIIPIIQYGYIYHAIAVRSDSPYNSLKDLIDDARKNPGKVSISHGGVGTSTHLIIEHLNILEKVNITAVPFQGGGPATVALLGGHVTALSAAQGTFLQHLRAGKLKLLASTAEKRIKDINNVPTLLELGYPNSVFTETYLIVAPKGTPPAVVEKLERTFRNVMKTQEYKTLADNYQVYMEDPLYGQRLKDEIEKDYTLKGELIRKLKLGK
jgi:tripartite-type tricarboxylate transporter receptor subunit TctC